MNITQLRRFVAVAEELHFPRAAARLEISLTALYSAIEKLEEEVGHPLITRGSATRLTSAGILLLPEARERIAAAPPPQQKSAAPSGGKAKASKGKGRAPVVKGQPKPYKKRQGR
ncbi:LysR family transcriptional regulator [Microbacterium sp. 2MCAF23]|uniref:LysR family transcriptional regulator n=1 Tax=Microbacterium sp. 2MCAF23 TaxID=3232985 RepID=UPI003F95A40A